MLPEKCLTQNLPHTKQLTNICHVHAADDDYDDLIVERDREVGRRQREGGRKKKEKENKG